MLRLILPLLVAAAGVGAWPGGAPSGACETQAPAHDPSTAADVTVPYALAAVQLQKQQTFMVDLSAAKHTFFRGFMISAEVDGVRGHGYFTHQPEDNDVKTLTCDNLCGGGDGCEGGSNAISHTANDDKRRITAFWQPNSNMAGKTVRFVATVVRRNDGVSEFWTDIWTQPITIA